MRSETLPITTKHLSSAPSLKPLPNSPTLDFAINDTMMIVDDPSTRLLISPSRFEEDEETNLRPLLSRTSSFAGSTSLITNGSKFNQRGRRRIGSENLLSSLSSSGDSGRAKKSISRDVGRAAAQTFLVTKLSVKLLTYLGVGYKWIMRFMALGCYSLMLFPGFIQIGYNYFFSSRIVRGIVFGDQPRNRLDLYLPKNNDGPKPVVAFVTGGAWIIGYKAWGSLLGMQLSERDIMVACIDYRNFPQGTMSDMVADASRGISFVCSKIGEYGGDPNRVYLMGQSAGAHIAACALVEQAAKEAAGDNIAWSVSQIKAYFGLSGGYNLFNLVDYFHSRGLYRTIFLGYLSFITSVVLFNLFGLSIQRMSQ